MWSSALPIAMLDAAQAVHSDDSGPRVPSQIDTQPAPMFGRIDGIENGPTRSGPFSQRILWQSWKLFRPADAGRDRGSDPLGLGLDLEPRVPMGLNRRGDHHLREAVHLA